MMNSKQRRKITRELARNPNNTKLKNKYKKYNREFCMYMNSYVHGVMQWRTADGILVRPQDMSAKHLKNLKTYLYREHSGSNEAWVRAVIHITTAEINRRNKPELFRLER